MFSHQEERSIEKVCYEQEHIKKVIELIKERLDFLLDPQDLEVIKEIILTEYIIFIEKKYKCFPVDSNYISYYQMIMHKAPILMTGYLMK